MEQEQNYNLLAQSRANYYTQGSPIQFVRVELLKGDVTGEIAVCLTFKNISQFPVTGLVIRFKCKSPAGEVLCEDQFYYEGINAGQGDLFGSDDAVYIGNDPVGSVEVTLDRAFLEDGSAHSLTGYKRVRLPSPKLLPPNLTQAMEERLGKSPMNTVPQVIDEGWYCACGAFHPNEEGTVYCSECGSDRIMLQNLLTSLMQDRPMQQPKEAQSAPQPEKPMTDQERFASLYHQERGDQKEEELDGATRQMDLPTMQVPSPAAAQNQYQTMDDYDDGDSESPAYSHPASHGRYEEEEEYRGPFSDEVARRIITLAPPITAILCAIVVALGAVAHFVG